jgi:hypothetical protein
LLGYSTWEGFVPNKHRRKVELLRKHPIAEIVSLAAELLSEDSFQRKISNARRDRDQRTMDLLNSSYNNWLEGRIERLGVELASNFD